MKFFRFLSLNLGLNILLVGAVVGCAFAMYPHHKVDFNADAGVGTPLPAWSHSIAVDFPGCHNIDNRPKTVVPNRVIVVTTAGDVKSMDFGKAWNQRKSFQFTTVGYCE